MKVVERVAVGVIFSISVSAVVTIGLDAMVDVASVTPDVIAEKQKLIESSELDYSQELRSDT